LDGVEVGSGTEADTLGFSTCSLLIGFDADSGCTGTPSNFLKGKLDEIRIYNYARTQDQIGQDYNAGVGTYLK
jgi:hypothetical protein